MQPQPIPLMPTAIIETSYASQPIIRVASAATGTKAAADAKTLGEFAVCPPDLRPTACPGTTSLATSPLLPKQAILLDMP